MSEPEMTPRRFAYLVRMMRRALADGRERNIALGIVDPSQELNEAAGWEGACRFLRNELLARNACPNWSLRDDWLDILVDVGEPESP